MGLIHDKWEIVIFPHLELSEEVFIMSIVYKCRHCGHVIGTIEQQIVETSMLGWDILSPEDRQDMIHYQQNGDIHIKAICENCEDSLGRHPEYHELDYFIQ